jgi:hypothetical protein
VKTDKQYQDFGKALFDWIADNNEHFFSFEIAEEIMEVAQKQGLV